MAAMIEALDSAYAPTAAQVAQAKAAGYSGWNGYFAGQNILNGWSDADFRTVLAGGMGTLAFCSGWSDATAMKIRGEQLGIPIMLDDEPGIRPPGGWEQAWLDTSGGGIYGNWQYIAGLVAPRHMLAAYPLSGDPGGESWPSWLPRPVGLCGWQWAGSHPFEHLTVDSEWLDVGFYGVFGPGGGTIGGDEMKTYIVNTPTEGQWLLCLPSGYYVHLTTPAAVAQFSADGATVLAVDEQQHQNLLASRPSSGSGGTPPPPGPAEPTTLTLDVPAQTITGQLK
jgi:hypothetical protein